MRINCKKVLACAVIAFFCSLLAYNVASKYMTTLVGDELQIVALDGTKKVIFRGAYVDGVWVSPSDHVSDCGNWMCGSDEVVYTAQDQSPLLFVLPEGKDRQLVFYSGSDAGRVSVTACGESVAIGMKGEEIHELGSKYPFIGGESHFLGGGFAQSHLAFLHLFCSFCTALSRKTVV